MARNEGQKVVYCVGSCTMDSSVYCADQWFSIHSKMAVTFYGELNNLSTANFLIENKKKKGKFYEVERVISRRTRKGKVKQH